MFDGKRHNVSISNFFVRIGLDWFILAIICMILLGYHWPEPGTQRGYFSLKGIAGFGVSLIFFFYGLKLSPEKLREGLSNWRLHLVVQLSTFIVFPVLVLLLRYVFDPGGNGLLWLGVYFLATLPSTVSSSVVMVSIAGGNVPGAIFNASISSLIGIFVTPLWMGMVLAGSASGFDLTDVILKLVLQVLLPVTLGVLLHPRFGRFADRHRAKLRYFDQSVILLIIYTAFAESFAKQMFKGHSAGELVILGIGMVALFFFFYGLITLISRLLRFNREDNITAVFCGSKKSLVHGTVMSKVLFPHAASAGVILLPLMIYHALQLIMASIIAQGMARRTQS